MDDTIVAVRFAESGEARRAMRELKRLDRDGRLRVREAALLERSGQGRIGVPGEGQDEDGFFMPPAGIVGMLVEAFAGPLGVVSHRPAESFRGHGGPSPTTVSGRSRSRTSAGISSRASRSSSRRSPTRIRTCSTRPSPVSGRP